VATTKAISSLLPRTSCNASTLNSAPAAVSRLNGRAFATAYHIKSIESRVLRHKLFGIFRPVSGLSNFAYGLAGEARRMSQARGPPTVATLDEVIE